MAVIQTRLTEEEDKILAKAAKLQRRSKREQLAYSAIEHAKSILLAQSGEKKTEGGRR